MRKLTEHKVNGVNDGLTITVLDSPGHGGACHAYGVSTDSNGSLCVVSFQNGPLSYHGPNGVTHEVLLAILIDRLRSFQEGPYACAENATALGNLTAALQWLKRRTESRVARGVEGTSTP